MIPEPGVDRRMRQLIQRHNIDTIWFGAAAPLALPKTSQSPELLRIRHSMSHVLAMAVQKLHPQAQVTIGPWTETGFYYDFDNPEPFSEVSTTLFQ
jgi:threonyl-tRNA synthetase